MARQGKWTPRSFEICGPSVQEARSSQASVAYLRFPSASRYPV